MFRLWPRIFQTAGTSVFNAGASAAVLAFTARLLGPEGRGTYAAATTWVALFSTLGSLSLGQSVVHSVAGRPPEEWLPKAVGTLFAIVAAIAAIDCGVVAAVYAVGDGLIFRHLDGHELWLAFTALPFLIANVNLPYFLYALNAIPTANAAQASGAAGLLGATLLLVGPLKFGVGGALAAFAIGAAITFAVASSYILRRCHRPKVDIVVAKSMLAGAGQLHLNTVGSYLLTQSTVLILNQFRPVYETGQYQLAVQLFSLSLLFSSAMGTVAYSLVATKGPDEAWPEHRSLIQRGLLLTLIAIPVGYVLAPVLIPLVAGQSFGPSVQLFRWLLPAAIGATLSSLMASQWIGRKLFWQASMITIATGVISVVLDFIIIPRFGMHGAVVSTLVTYGLSGIANAAMAIWVQRVAYRKGLSLA